MACLTVAMACGADPLQAAQLANVAGSLVVQKSGTATATAAELLHELSRRQVAEPALLPPRRSSAASLAPLAARRARS
jgi:bifunctional ADP-heptose synthase (sugar kinase/adenylyltransferase)